MSFSCEDTSFIFNRYQFSPYLDTVRFQEFPSIPSHHTYTPCHFSYRHLPPDQGDFKEVTRPRHRRQPCRKFFTSLQPLHKTLRDFGLIRRNIVQKYRPPPLAGMSHPRIDTWPLPALLYLTPPRSFGQECLSPSTAAVVSPRRGKEISAQPSCCVANGLPV